MKDAKADGVTIFLLGAAVGAAAALLMAPAPGARTRRRLASKGAEAADYLIDAGKELVEECADLYERSGEIAGEATRDLAEKYRALHEHSKRLMDEAETILRRVKKAVPLR